MGESVFDDPLEGGIFFCFEKDVGVPYGPGMVLEKPEGVLLSDQVGAVHEFEFEEFVAESAHVKAMKVPVDMVKEFGGEGIEVRWHLFS